MSDNSPYAQTAASIRYHIAGGGCPDCTCCTEVSCNSQPGGGCIQVGKTAPLQQWWECPCVSQADDITAQYERAIEVVDAQWKMALSHLELALKVLTEDAHPAGHVLAEQRYNQVFWLYTQTLTAQRLLSMDFTS
jgi:hypothetical protein